MGSHFQDRFPLEWGGDVVALSMPNTSNMEVVTGIDGEGAVGVSRLVVRIW
jgi:hypothetical protein